MPDHLGGPHIAPPMAHDELTPDARDMRDGPAGGAATGPDLEQALRESERSFREMAENVPGALFRYILRADGTDSVLYMSPRCEELWELPAESIVRDATQLWQQIDPEDLPGMQASVMESARTLEPWYWEWRITTPSGRRKWLQGSGRPQRQADGSVVWNTFILDVTDRKLAEDEQRQLRGQLRQSQKLESLGRLAGGIAHDFNNILTVILGYGEAALLELPDDAPIRPYLQEIVAAGERSAGMVRQMLAFARRQPSAPVSLDVGTHLNELSRMLHRLVGDDVMLDTDIALDAWRVRMDPAHLDQIVTNLVVNARDAMVGGGRLVLRLRNEPAGASLDGFPPPERDVVRLEVADTGVGMEPTTVERIFEPFYTTKADGGGTGLGLATVYGIVHQLGGTIDVDTAPGRGARFVLRFPRDEALTAPRTPEPRSIEGRLSGSVLVVEDEPQLRRFVQLALQREGMDVRVAASGDEALHLLKGAAEPPDLLLTDALMPGMNGLELIARVRQRHPGVAAVVMTGYIGDEEVQAAISAQGIPVLPKPFGKRDLCDALRRALAARAP